ncbi:RNA binding protein (contains ribosomal protein S1 domain) [Legionella santicrucis]|uniref:RNA binding protein (Contains ribosomal protein S1 domain) n=1 Tax=Legionella santicrucis TaxID=45074 RepID=A0A0W0YI22_9GAMM|nr:hypothetical protein [Legionella santicrucis]KTD56549.1 RNA binding protein (contains ribosomal protein S1 domain) [Legionella santicrucis]
MIILYVPFEAHEQGDLVIGTELWRQAHQSSSTEEIYIHYHKQPLDKYTSGISRVYICAHGSENGNDLYNRADDNTQIKKISIPVLAERFNHDFLFLAPKIQQIHLYCCGNEDKNERIATLFQSYLLRTEYSSIHFYKGTLGIPKSQPSYLHESSKKIKPEFVMIEEEQKYCKQDTDLSFLKKERAAAQILQYKYRREEMISARRLNFFSTSMEIANDPMEITNDPMEHRQYNF